MARPTGGDDAKVLADHSFVEQVYEELKRKSISFEFRPGDRLNEVAIARQIGVSRTPLREALNRLTADGFLTFIPGRGFFRKPLAVKEVFDLYEFRLLLETGAVRLAVDRAEPAAIADLDQFLCRSADDVPERTIDDLVALDEEFHEGLISLARNVEMVRILQHVNARIRYVRWIAMEGRRDGTQSEHHAILECITRHDAEKCITLLHDHIEHRLDQIVDAVKKSYARIYVAG